MADYNIFGAGMLAFQSSYAHVEDSIFIDPTLESSQPSNFDSFCGQPVQRFLGEAQRTAYFNVDVPMHASAMQNPPRATTAISAMPPASQVRFTSPSFSSSDHSSSGGGETEYTDYDAGPMTPPEMFPSYSVHQESYSHPIQFMSMGPSYSNGMELQTNHQHEYTDNESIVDFANYCEPVPMTSTPSDSVQPVVEDEYPPPPKAERDDNESDEDAAPSPKRQNESDDDDEYRPSKKLKPSARTPTRRHPRGRQAAVENIANLVANTVDSPTSRRRPNRPTTAAAHGSHLPSPPRALPHNSKGFFACPECPKRDFKDRVDYDNHVKKMHTRPFPCVFSFAGCDSTFASKNEWKRHVTTQHLLLQYWLCQEGMCAKTCNNNGLSSGKKAGAAAAAATATVDETSSSDALPNGAIFNRKDLFTQHLKRMHTPAQVKRLPGHSVKGVSSTSSNKADSSTSHTPQEREVLAKWNAKLRSFQDRGRRDRCKLPMTMTCPVETCEETPFQGPDAWDQRMEHVAKHLERAAAGKEADVVFGGEGDVSLVGWASSPEVGIITRDAASQNWVLRKPLERTGGRVIVILPGGSNAAVAAPAPAPAPAVKTEFKHERKLSSIVVKEESDNDEDVEEGEEDADGEDE